MNRTLSLLSLCNTDFPFISLPPFLLSSQLSFRSVIGKHSLSPFVFQSNHFHSKIKGSITNSQFDHYLSQILHLSQTPSHVITTRQAIEEGSEWTLKKTIFRDSGGDLLGGIIYASFAGLLAILDSQIINNHALQKGESLFASVTEAFLQCLLFDLSRTETDQEGIGGNTFWIEHTNTEIEDISIYRSWESSNTGDAVYFFYRGFSKATRVNSTSSFSNFWGEPAGTNYECERETTYSFINAVNGSGHNFLHLRNVENTSLEFFVEYFNVINCYFSRQIFHTTTSKMKFSFGFVFGNSNTEIGNLVTLANCTGDFDYEGMTKVNEIQTMAIKLSQCNYPGMTERYTNVGLRKRIVNLIWILE